MNFYMITNVGTYVKSDVVMSYRRHLILAQLWDQPGYAERTKELINNGAIIMLDNGAHEDIDVDLDFYARVIDESKAHIVVLPDLVGRSNIESREHSLAFISQHTKMLYERRLIYASQGRTTSEIFDEYEWAMAFFHHLHFTLALGQSYLCFLNPKDLNDEQQTHHEEARVRLLRRLMESVHFEKHQWHILGARWRGIQIFGKIPQITGIDSVKPCICSLTATYVYPERPPMAKEFDHTLPCCVDDYFLKLNVRRFASVYGARLDYDPKRRRH